jgi:hypothetical protein
MKQPARHRLAAGLPALAALLAGALPLGAQEKPVTPVPANADTVKIGVSGRVQLDYVGRSREITAFTDSLSNPFGGFPSATGTSKAENSFEGYAAVRLDVELSRKVSALLEIGNRRVEGEPPAFPATTPDGGILRWGGEASMPVFLREAAAIFDDFIVPDLRFEAGLSRWSFDVRGRDSSFAFQPRRSQTLTRNLDSDGTLNVQDDAALRFSEAAWVDELEPVGACLTWSREGLVFDLVLLPAVIEGGQPDADESFYAIDGWYGLDEIGKGSRVGLIAALHKARTSTIVGGFSSGDGNVHAQIFTVGGGADLKFADGAIEVFGEGYVQFGKAGELANSQGDIDAAGRAFRIGLEWRHTVGNPMPVWAGASWFYLSGDGDTDPADDKADKFASYEGTTDLMILEDPYYGFDWDSNMKGFKINAGARVTAASKDDLEITALLGLLKAAEDLLVPGGGTGDSLGNEIDVRLAWSVTKQFVLKFSAAWLVGSDLLEEAMGGAANPHADDSSQLYVLGFDLTF